MLRVPCGRQMTMKKWIEFHILVCHICMAFHVRTSRPPKRWHRRDKKAWF